ncbi:MAG: S8 family serine peptidase [Tepidisphaera sp.]|nr:S8 family serine peptidase [Tepidisphaera sp.]
MRWNRCVMVLACVAGLATASHAQIQWKSGSPAPTFIEGGGLAKALDQLAARADDPRVVVHLSAPITDAGRARLAASGLTLLAPLGDNSFFATLDVKTLAPAGLAPWVVGVSAIDPAWKLHKSLATGEALPWASGNAPPDIAPDNAARGGQWVAVYVQFHDDVSPTKAVLDKVESFGGKVRDVIFISNYAVVEMPRANVAALARESIVQWIEPAAPLFGALNAENRALTGANIVQASPYNLSGQGVKVFVFDAGGVYTGHMDLMGRVTVIDGSAAIDHSTHVAGTVGGTGAASGGMNRGMAPGVTFLSAALNITGQTGWLYTNPVDIVQDYTTAYSMGAHIATNSIGTNVANNGFPCSWEGDYQETDRTIDSIVRGSAVTNGNPFRVVWAAGNERNSGTCGSMYNTIGPPAGAKNHLSIGAVNANDDSMTSFSGWGPTDDGRMKPDFAAPGCQVGGDNGVTSCLSSGPTAYGVLCGTSMATPTVTGCAALLMQDYRVQFPFLADPRNSTLKVLFAQSAVDRGNPGPDYQFGYGSIRVQAAIDLMRQHNFLEDEVSQGVDKFFFTQVAPGDTSLTLTLAWDDVPGTANVVPELVNDLDLEVISPDGTQAFPWTLNPASPASPAVRTQANHRDNLEQVKVDNPAPGTWSVRIRAFNVPQGPQPFSLVSSNVLSQMPSVYLTPVELVHSPVLPGTPSQVGLRIDAVSDTLVDGSAHMLYRFSPTADFTSVPLTPPAPGSSEWTATLPGFTCTDLPEYYFEATGATSGHKTLPAAGATAAYQASPGELAVRYHEDFESGPAGWVGGQPGDTATTGQWDLQAPEGTWNTQPAADVTPGAGTKCWITDGRAGNAAGQFDVDNGYTTLVSAPYNLDRAPEATISYYLSYYSNHAGQANADKFKVQVSPDGTNWTTVDMIPAASPPTPAWVQHTFRVGDFITPSATTQVRFIATDLTSAILEAAIDEVTIIAHQCIDTPACNPDLNQDGVADQGDVDYLINVVAGGENPSGVNADFNNDGVADQGDVDALINVVAGGPCP